MPSRGHSRAMLAMAALELAVSISREQSVDIMCDRLGIPPDPIVAKERSIRVAKQKRNTYTGPHCPECHGVIAINSPCMRRSCVAFNKPNYRLEPWRGRYR